MHVQSFFIKQLPNVKQVLNEVPNSKQGPNEVPNEGTNFKQGPSPLKEGPSPSFGALF